LDRRRRRKRRIKRKKRRKERIIRRNVSVMQFNLRGISW